VRRVIKVATANNMPAPEEKNIQRKFAGSREGQIERVPRSLHYS
jgi:hypothetical protein